MLENVKMIDSLVDSMTKKELSELNKKIIERFKFLQEQETSLKLSHFNIYDLVILGRDDHEKYAVIVKINQKTIGVVCEHNTRWNVSPQALSKVKKDPHEIKEILKKRFPFFEEKEAGFIKLMNDL